MTKRMKLAGIILAMVLCLSTIGVSIVAFAGSTVACKKTGVVVLSQNTAGKQIKQYVAADTDANVALELLKNDEAVQKIYMFNGKSLKFLYKVTAESKNNYYFIEYAYNNKTKKAEFKVYQNGRVGVSGDVKFYGYVTNNTYDSHNATKVETTATCTEVGVKEYWYCSQCENYFEDENCAKLIKDFDAWKIGDGKAEAFGHEFAATNGIQNVADGEHNFKCVRCDAYGIGTTADETEACSGGTATCTAKAVCDVCNTEYGDVDSSNHTDLVDDDAVEATCTTTGLTAGQHCNDCQVVTIPQQEIPALGHECDIFYGVQNVSDGEHNFKCKRCDTWGVGSIADGTEHCDGGTATCTAKAVCDVCNTEYGDVDSSNHTDLVDDDAVDATCTTAGKTAGQHCEACNTVVTPQQEIPALGHDWDEGVWDWSEDGKTATVTFTCTRDASHIELVNATVTSEVTKAPSCTEMGTTTYTATVTFEGTEYTDTIEIDDIAVVPCEDNDGDNCCDMCGKQLVFHTFCCPLCEKATGCWAGDSFLLTIHAMVHIIWGIFAAFGFVA